MNMSVGNQQDVAPAIPHLEWDGAKFTRQAPRKPPRMSITIEVIQDQSLIPAPLPFPPDFRPNPVDTTTLADSGAQTCSGDMPLLVRLGCTTKDLLPTSHGIRGVAIILLKLLGVLPVHITAGKYSTNLM